MFNKEELQELKNIIDFGTKYNLIKEEHLISQICEKINKGIDNNLIHSEYGFYKKRIKDSRSNSYYHMKNRCYSEKYQHYKDYGGRGISVCDRWLGEEGFRNFCVDMGERPEGTSLDRVDSNGNYEPNNCKWSTVHEQNSNRRSSNKNVGVTKNKQGYQAYLMYKGKSYFKRFNTEEEAIEYRQELEKKYLGK